MATKFQPSSFIPKESLSTDSDEPERKKRRRGFNFFMLIGIIVFGFSLIVAGSVFGYKQYLEGSLEDSKTELAEITEAFEPDLIEELSMLDKRITTAEALLANHTTISPLFTLLEDRTLQSVQFTELGFSLTDEGANVRLRGIARDYPSVALQSDIFGENQFIKNPIFSDFTREETEEVTFAVTFSVDDSFLLYQNTLE